MIENTVVGFDYEEHLRCRTQPLRLFYTDSELRTEIFRDESRCPETGASKHGSDVYIERSGNPMVDIPVGHLTGVEIVGGRLVINHTHARYDSPLSLGTVHEMVDATEFVKVASDGLD